MSKVLSVTDTFREAVYGLEDEPFYRSPDGLTLATRWTALAAEVLDWNTLNSDRTPLQNMGYLASRYDITLVIPYYSVGMRDHLLIEKAILEDIDAELAAKL